MEYNNQYNLWSKVWLMKCFAVLLAFCLLTAHTTTVFAESISESELLEAPAVSSLKSVKDKALTVYFTKVKGAKGYEAEAALDADFTIGVKTVKSKKSNTSSIVINKLKSGRVYYVRLRYWKKVDGQKVYSDWSEVSKKRVKIFHDTKIYGSRLSSAKKKAVTKEIDKFIKREIKAGMTDEEVYLRVARYIVFETPADSDYTMPYRHNENTAWAVLFYEHAACSGFSRITKAMFDSVGIPCKHINPNQWQHQWNMVKINGEWIKLDTQLLKFMYVHYGITF